MTRPDAITIWSLPLGDKSELRLALDTFNGKPRADLRTWADFSAGPMEMRSPTKKGVSIAIEDLPAVAGALRDAVVKARDLGLLARSEMQPE